MWVKTLPPEDGVESYDVLELRAEGTWRSARISGELNRPRQVHDMQLGERFKVEPHDPLFGTSLVLDELARDGDDRRRALRLDYVSADVMGSGLDLYRRWRGSNLIDSSSRATSRPATTTPPATVKALVDQHYVWPPPLDPTRLVGTWELQLSDPSDPLDHYLLELNDDRTWRIMVAHGDPANPLRLTVRERGHWWEVEPPDIQHRQFQTVLALYRERAKRGTNDRVSGGGPLRLITADELHLEPDAVSITVARQYKRWRGAPIPMDKGRS